MKLSQLRALLAVIDNDSFSEAALELDMSQAAVSYAVAELEKTMGVKLLERGRFGARPTVVGNRVAAHARSILRHEAAIMQEVSVEQGVLAGVLRVAVFRSAAGRVLPGIMKALKKQYPKLIVKLIEVDDSDAEGRTKEQLVREHLADIAFTEASGNTENLIIWEVMRDDYRAIVPEDDPRTVVHWTELNDDTFIYSSCIFCSERLRTHLDNQPTDITPAYHVKEDSTILRMVSQGLGMSVLPELAIDELPANVKVLPMHEPLERIIHVALLPGSLKMPAVRAFLTVLKKQFPESDVPAFTQPQLELRLS